MPRFFFFILTIFFIGEGPLRLQAQPTKQSTSLRLSHGFDFPVAPPDAEKYYKSRGFRPGGHLGEDWIHDGGSSQSFGHPVFNIADGMVILARDVHVAWGNVIVIRHAYYESHKVQYIDSLYAHLDRINVKEGDFVTKGQHIGNIGNNHGMYPAHLHFEIHKNLNIGVNHTGFAKTFLNYWSPTEFIAKRRNLSGGPKTTSLPITHFDIPAPWRSTQHGHRSKRHNSYSPLSKGSKKASIKPSASKIHSDFRVNRYDN